MKESQERKAKKESNGNESEREEDEARMMMISSRWIHLSLRLKKWLLRLKLNKKNLQAFDKAVGVNSMAAESSTVKPKEVKGFRLSLVQREVGLSPLVEKLNEKHVPNDANESQGKSFESHRLLKFISGENKSRCVGLTC